MVSIKKRHKPFYKQFLQIRKNVQNRPKLLKFKKQKWKKLQEYSRRLLKFYKRFKIRDQYKLKTTKFASRGNSFQKNFRNNSIERKTFNLFYGGLSKKYLKKNINLIKARKHPSTTFETFRHQTLKFFESRLDVVLYRSKFSLSIKSARQLILHGHILVNGATVRTKSYILKTDDVIEVAYNSKSRTLIKNSIDRSNFWPIPPKHLLINYRTYQIIFVYDKNSNLLPTFEHYLNLDSILTNINRY
jgi:ribosomal protein S4